MEVSDEVLNRALLYRDRRDFVIRAGDTGIRVESEKDEPMTETSEHDTLLAHLAWKLSDRHEGIAVEALGYIFRSSQARRVLEEMLRARGADVGSIEEVRTQATGKEGARPDLAGVDRTGLERVLIEAKFWAGLTGNQDDPTKQDRLIKGLDGFLERDQDRALFDLPPKAVNPQGGAP